MSSSATTAPPIPRYSGVKTFFRRPHIPYNSESFLCARKPFDAAIVGVPFDIGVSFRTGQREGPSAVRNISHLSQVNFKLIYKYFVTYYFTLYENKIIVIMIQKCIAILCSNSMHIMPSMILTYLATMLSMSEIFQYHPIRLMMRLIFAKTIS